MIKEPRKTHSAKELGQTAQNNIKQRGQRILELRKKLLGVSRADFCKGFKWSAQSLKAWELSWGGGLSEDRAKDLVKHLREKYDIHTTASWLMHGIGMPPRAVTAGFEISAEEEEHIAKELLMFRELSGSVDAIMQDDGMIPAFYPGDFVGGILTSSYEVAIDKECIITDASGQTYIRTLKKGDKKNFYHLVCCNTSTSLPKEIKNISIQSVAPIVWIRRRKPT